MNLQKIDKTIAYKYQKIKEQLQQRQKAQVLQLQFIWTYSKELQKIKEKKKTRKCYKYKKVGYLTKNYKLGQMKNKSIQEELENKDKEDNNKEVSFVKDLEQIWYDKSLYISKFPKN